MIKLIKGQTNVVHLTLTEKVKLSNPFFLFEFTSNDTGKKTYIQSVDYSGYKERSNIFYINDPIHLDLIPGSYDYQVYETEHENNLVVGSASNIVEIGLMVCRPEMGLTSSIKEVYKDNDGTDDNIVYDG